jgi:hypothetical protein
MVWRKAIETSEVWKSITVWPAEFTAVVINGGVIPFSVIEYY